MRLQLQLGLNDMCVTQEVCSANSLKTHYTKYGHPALSPILYSTNLLTSRSCYETLWGCWGQECLHVLWNLYFKWAVNDQNKILFHIHTRFWIQNLYIQEFVTILTLSLVTSAYHHLSPIFIAISMCTYWEYQCQFLNLTVMAVSILDFHSGWETHQDMVNNKLDSGV